MTKSAAIACADKLSKRSFILVFLNAIVFIRFVLMAIYSSRCTAKHLFHFISTQNQRNMECLHKKIGLIVGFMANGDNVFYQTFTNVFFVFFSLCFLRF